MSVYLQVPGMQGNVTAKGLEGFIELESFDLSVVRNMLTKTGAISDREGTKAVVSEVTFTKRTDKTSPLFFVEAATGTAKPQVVIKFVNTGANLNEYLMVTLTNVIVSSYKISDETTTAAESSTPAQYSKPVEQITLNFTKVELKYTPYDDQHNAGSPVASSYDIGTGTAG